MEHLITISIILAGLYIPYTISRYLIFKKEFENLGDVLLYWVTPILIGSLIAFIIAIYQLIYNSL